MPVNLYSKEDLVKMTNEDLLEARTKSVNEVEDIQAQLGDKDRRDKHTGRRMAPRDYHAWRKSTKKALGYALQNLRMVKDVISERSAEDRLLEVRNPLMRQAASLLAQFSSISGAGQEIPDSLLDQADDLVAELSRSS